MTSVPEQFRDPVSDVIIAEDRAEPGDWRVEYFDDDGRCYVTIFAGPAAEVRARAYFGALKGGSPKALRVN